MAFRKLTKRAEHKNKINWFCKSCVSQKDDDGVVLLTIFQKEAFYVITVV
jgi:hypothetical protein